MSTLDTIQIFRYDNGGADWNAMFGYLQSIRETNTVNFQITDISDPTVFGEFQSVTSNSSIVYDNTYIYFPVILYRGGNGDMLDGRNYNIGFTVNGAQGPTGQRGTIIFYGYGMPQPGNTGFDGAGPNDEDLIGITGYGPTGYTVQIGDFYFDRNTDNMYFYGA